MSRQTTNWLDRGDSVDEPLARVLAATLSVPLGDPRLADPILIVRAQVAAGGTEAEVANYIRTLFALFERPLLDTGTHRLLGTAIWHIIKAGMLRDA